MKIPYLFVQIFSLAKGLHNLDIMIQFVCMELLDIYRQSQLHKIIESDKHSGMLSHCYLLCSADRELIRAFATDVVKDIFCSSDSSPCDACVSCNKISHNNMVDVISYPKGDGNLVVDDIVDIVSDCYIRPVESEYKVYILYDFDLCTVQAQNKMLKTLEEPPQNVIFILTCSTMMLVLQTILSRSKKIEIPPLDKSVVTKLLNDNNIANAIEIASMSAGNITRAMGYARENESKEMLDLVFDMLLGLNSSSDVLKYSSKITAFKKQVPDLLGVLSFVLRDIAVVGKIECNFKNREDKIRLLSQKYSPKMIAEISVKVADCLRNISSNCNLNGVIDSLLLGILEVRFLCQ